MVQINLLPVEAKKRHKGKIEFKIKLGPVLGVLIGVMLIIIVVWASLAMQLSAKEKKLSRLDEQLDSLGFTLDKLDQLEEERETLLSKLEFMDKTLKTEVLWAKNLNRLSNLLPPGIWIKSIILHTVTEGNLSQYLKLDITGSAIAVADKEPIDAIGGLMTTIKQDEIFSDQFSEIELISSQRGKFGEIVSMDFKLVCQYK